MIITSRGEPNAVVLAVRGAVAQRQHDFPAHVDGQATEHRPRPGFERLERLQHEGEGNRLGPRGGHRRAPQAPAAALWAFSIWARWRSVWKAARCSHCRPLTQPTTGWLRVCSLSAWPGRRAKAIKAPRAAWKSDTRSSRERPPWGSSGAGAATLTLGTAVAGSTASWGALRSAQSGSAG